MREGARSDAAGVRRCGKVGSLDWDLARRRLIRIASGRVPRDEIEGVVHEAVIRLLAWQANGGPERSRLLGAAPTRQPSLSSRRSSYGRVQTTGVAACAGRA